MYRLSMGERDSSPTIRESSVTLRRSSEDDSIELECEKRCGVIQARMLAAV